MFYTSPPVFSLKISILDLFLDTINEYLLLFKDNMNPDFENGWNIDFMLNIESHSQRISPILQFAKPDDAEDVVTLFKDVYKGTYPYKELEDENEVRKMITRQDFHWLLFKLNIKGQ